VSSGQVPDFWRTQGGLGLVRTVHGRPDVRLSPPAFASLRSASPGTAPHYFCDGRHRIDVILVTLPVTLPSPLMRRLGSNRILNLGSGWVSRCDQYP